MGCQLLCDGTHISDNHRPFIHFVDGGLARFLLYYITMSAYSTDAIQLIPTLTADELRATERLATQILILAGDLHKLRTENDVLKEQIFLLQSEQEEVKT
jgi:cell division protein FtsB